MVILAALGFLLAGCRDTRRETVRSWLQANPPEGFETATIPEEFVITKTADGTSETVVSMRYRLTRPTIEIRDIFSLPRGAALAQRLSTVRGWALSSLPAGDPTRDAIAADSSAARDAFPIKRVVTAKGAEIDAQVVVTLGKTPNGWRVKSQTPVVNAPGSPDQNPRIPFEDSTEVAAKLDELEVVTGRLEESRRKYLAERQQAAERSLARFRSVWKTGHIFEGHLPDRTPVRLVVSQGADTGNSIVAIVTVQRANQSSARYTGGITQQPSGEAAWRAAQVTSLSGSDGEPLTDSSFHPILTVTATDNGLSAEAKTGSGKVVSFKLDQTGVADLIPDKSPQGTVND